MILQQQRTYMCNGYCCVNQVHMLNNSIASNVLLLYQVPATAAVNTKTLLYHTLLYPHTRIILVYYIYEYIYIRSIFYHQQYLPRDGGPFSFSTVRPNSSVDRQDLILKAIMRIYGGGIHQQQEQCCCRIINWGCQQQSCSNDSRATTELLLCFFFSK